MIADWPGDDDVQRALDWMIDVVGRQRWEDGRVNIESHLRSLYEPGIVGGRDWIEERLRQRQLPNDTFAWYLYLGDAYASDPVRYESMQGARVVPILKVIGRDLNALSREPDPVLRTVHV